VKQKWAFKMILSERKKWASKVNLSETKNGHLGALSENIRWQMNKKSRYTYREDN